MLECFQPEKIGRKIRVFSLGRKKNNILIKNKKNVTGLCVYLFYPNLFPPQINIISPKTTRLLT